VTNKFFLLSFFLSEQDNILQLSFVAHTSTTPTVVEVQKMAEGVLLPQIFCGHRETANETLWRRYMG